MMKFRKITIFLLFLTTFNVYSSGENPVSFSFKKVDFKTHRLKYYFSFDSEDNGILKKLSYRWDRSPVNEVQKILPEMKDIVFTKILMTSDLEPDPDEESLTLIIPFNPKFHNLEGENEWTVDIIRLFFSNEKLILWSLAKAVDEKPGNWNISEYDVASGKYEIRGIEVSTNNPFSEFDFSAGNF